jgi:hypothetical protein
MCRGLDMASSGAVQSDIIGTGRQLLILKEFDNESWDISEATSVWEKT